MSARPLPSLDRAELQRELEKLTDEQMATLDAGCPEYFSSRSRAAWLYQEAVRRAWLLGPA